MNNGIFPLCAHCFLYEKMLFVQLITQEQQLAEKGDTRPVGYLGYSGPQSPQRPPFSLQKFNYLSCLLSKMATPDQLWLKAKLAVL